jgi:hypothetical protein
MMLAPEGAQRDVPTYPGPDEALNYIKFVKDQLEIKARSTTSLTLPVLILISKNMP